MTFESIDGVLIINDGNRIIASTTSHVIEKNVAKGHMRLTFGAINVEFQEEDISFHELVKLLPR
jgi:hypothetical protein